MVATCAANETCVRYGTRGYVLNYQAAQQLLRHAEPAVVQVDALISLLAAYEPSSLRLFWCTSNIAHASSFRWLHQFTYSCPTESNYCNRASRVWDGCVLRCILLDAPAFVLAPWAVLAGLALYSARWGRWTRWRT